MCPRRARDPSRLDEVALGVLMRGQDGVVSRRQVLELGGTDRDITSRLSRRDWTRIHPGVYLDHTGRPTWQQRAWAAVLARWPAALGGVSAVRAHGLRGAGADDAAALRIVVAAGRSVDPLPGARIERITDFDRVAGLHLHPPRTGLEHALLKAAAGLDEDGAVGLLADACQQRRTTAARLVSELTSMPRLRHRALLLQILRGRGLRRLLGAGAPLPA